MGRPKAVKQHTQVLSRYLHTMSLAFRGLRVGRLGGITVSHWCAVMSNRPVGLAQAGRKRKSRRPGLLVIRQDTVPSALVCRTYSEHWFTYSPTPAQLLITLMYYAYTERQGTYCFIRIRLATHTLTATTGRQQLARLC